MGRGSWNKQQHVVPGAHKAMDNFKYEIANELGLPVQQNSEDYWGEISSRDCGAVGGHMVRRMIEMAEGQISQNGGGMGLTGGTTSSTMTSSTTGGTMTSGSTGSSTGAESSLARGTTFRSGNQQNTGTTGGTMTSGTTGSGTTGQETSQSRGTTFNSNRR